MATDDFTQLILWQKSQALALDVIRTVSALPRNRAAESIGNQLTRSAGSIPANIAEGYGRYSQAAYRSHLSIARGSLFETQSWIDLLWRADFITLEAKNKLLAGSYEVGRMLTARMKSLADATKSYAARDEAALYDIES